MFSDNEACYRAWWAWPSNVQNVDRWTFPTRTTCLCGWKSFQSPLAPTILCLGSTWKPCTTPRLFYTRNQVSLARQYVFGSPLHFFNRYSILPAISLDGILHLEVLDHAYSGEEFASFVRGLLDQMQPWPLLNSVIILDNASIHKVPGIREMVEERCKIVSYSSYQLWFIFFFFIQWKPPYLSSCLFTGPESRRGSFLSNQGLAQGQSHLPNLWDGSFLRSLCIDMGGGLQ